VKELHHMIEPVAVTVSWGPRAETARECAARLIDSLGRIPSQPDVYSRWSVCPDGGANGPDDLLPAPTDLDQLANLVENTALRNDRGELMNGGGFSPRLTRLHCDRPVDYLVRCGVGGKRLGNHGLLELPHPKHADPGVLEGHTLDATLVALVDAWRPDHGSIITHSFRTAQKINFRAKEIPIGWMTYIANSVPVDNAKLPALPQITETGQGRFLQLHGNAQEPSLDDALAIRRALGYETP
jgi:hypothetical protein